MKKWLKMLPLLALLGGVGLAFAGATPKDVVNTKQAFISNQWVTISDEQEYSCALNPEHNCTRELNPMGQVVSEVKGDYEVIP